MKKLKVMTVVGTRPEIIRLSMLLPKLDEVTEHVLVHTGQNHDELLNSVFFRDFALRAPDYYLSVDSTSFGLAMGQVITNIEKVLNLVSPDAVIILGDTNSAIAAIVAERMQIPVYHLEAGNRSFDRNVPEELNRRMVDHVSTFNLPYNQISLRNLLAEGIHSRFTCITGSPIREIFEAKKSQIQDSKVLDTLELEFGEFFLASVHRQENVDYVERLQTIFGSLEDLARKYQRRVLVSTHPRTRAKVEAAGLKLSSLVELHPPLGFLDYAKLQMSAACTISDSGTIAEESAIMGFPAVTIRDSMERPEAFEAGSIAMSGLTSDGVLAAVDFVLGAHASPRSIPAGYEVSDFSHRVINFLLSTARQHKTWSNLIR